MQQSDQSMNTPNLTGDVNYLPSGTSPDANQAGQDVTNLGEPTVDGAVTATTPADRITGAFLDPANSLANAASITAGGSITISVNNQYALQQTAGDGTLGGLAFGAAVSVASIHNNTQAYLGTFDRLKAGANITIQATDQASQPVKVTGVAGAAGLYAASANVITLNVTSNTSAQMQNNSAILGGAAVTIAANQTSNLTAGGYGFQGGVAAIGAVVTLANVNVNDSAGIGDGATVGTTLGNVVSLAVSTTSNNSVTSSALVGAGGVGAGSYGHATADINVAGGTSLGDVGIYAYGAVNDTAASTQTASATSNEITPGIVLGFGGSVPTANIEGSMLATIASGATIVGGSLNLAAQSTDNASAYGQAFGTGFITGAATDAEADVNVMTEAIHQLGNDYAHGQCERFGHGYRYGQRNRRQAAAERVASDLRRHGHVLVRSRLALISPRARSKARTRPTSTAQSFMPAVVLLCRPLRATRHTQRRMPCHWGRFSQG